MVERSRGISHENERIYVSAGERDLKKAIRVFKERQLANDYDPKPELFYKKLNTRWCSCLMQTQCQLEKVWLFDCDSDDDAAAVEADLAEHYTNPITPYRYPSKSGHHIVVGPFNKTKQNKTKLNPGVKALLHDNALMLWGY